MCVKVSARCFFPVRFGCVSSMLILAPLIGFHKRRIFALVAFVYLFFAIDSAGLYEHTYHRLIG